MKNATELQFIETVRREQVLPPGSKVTAAVSGGSDSVGLLLLLLRFREHMGWDVSALHVDHRWRPDSGLDAAFVEETCARLCVPCRVRRLDPRSACGSPEADFSEARQTIYEEEAGGGLVAVGHTADDRAETLLLRLLEGSGLRGLGGMDYRGIGPVRRPLLDLGRGEIRGYLGDRGFEFREDPTNSDTSLLRNRIRAELLPAAERVRPGATRRLARSSALLSCWGRMADEKVAEALAGCEVTGQGFRSLDREAWAELPPPVGLSVLWVLCGRPRAGGGELEKTERWLRSGGKGSKALPDGTVLVADGSLLRFEGPAPIGGGDGAPR